MSNLNKYQGWYRSHKYLIEPLKNNQYLVIYTPPKFLGTTATLPVEKFDSIEDCIQSVQEFIDYLIAKSLPSTIDESETLE